MRLPFHSTLLTVILATLVHASVPLPKSDQGSNKRYVQGQYIVEFHNNNILGGKRASFNPHHEVYRTLRRRGIPFNIVTEFKDSAHFIGATFQLSSQENVAKIAEIPGVKAIRPEIRIPAPRPIKQFAVSDSNDTRLPPDPFSTHVMTGVDRVHRAGFDGKGIKIAIIDSGVDYNHPSLGSGFGPGHKVSSGFDFVGDQFNGTGPPVPDSDPLDTCNGHGTHVAGIIGADPGNQFNIQGVAYGASLAAYRIFGCTGETTDSLIVGAMLMAEKEGADIITLSIGGPDGWTESSGAVVASRLASSGKVVTVAAGNEGSDGSWFASSPASGIDAISVASVENVVISAQNATVKGVDHAPIPYLQTSSLKFPGDLPIYATSTDVAKTDDACSPLPDTTPDLSKFLVLIHRGTCLFSTKLGNAAAKGGKFFLIYNSDTGDFSAISPDNLTAALISAEDGKFLVREFAKKSPITLSFPDAPANVKSPKGGLISDFSTYGPTFDMHFKPAVAAPGGNILSTLPLALGKFGVESGTSMATPFVAGAAALILQARGKSVNARGIRDLLETTAAPVAQDHTDGSLFQTASQQGAGLIQVFNALTTETIISPGHLNLNDTAHFQSRQTIKITNIGDKPVTYDLTHLPAGTATTVVNDVVVKGPVPLTSQFATAQFDKKKIVVAPGKTEEVQVTFTAPEADPTGYPIYSGFIRVKSATETLKVTYLGVAATLKNKSILDRSDRMFNVSLPVLLDNQSNPQVGEQTYTLATDDTPTIRFRLNFGSPLVRLDLLDKKADGQPVAKRDTLKKRSWFTWWWDAGAAGRSRIMEQSSFKSVETLGVLAEFDWTPRNVENTDMPRNQFYEYSLEGLFANGSFVPNGEYKVLLRALRVTGNPEDQSDYETWMSTPFKIAAPPIPA